MIASLGMYDMPPVQAANDRYWALIAEALNIDVPLTRGPGAYWDAWASPDLILSQTCGYPYRARLHHQVTLVGTPDYGLPGCAPGYYCSVFVARKDDARDSLAAFDGARFAYNEPLSQSGWAAPQTHALGLGLHLPPSLQTGGHALSAAAVAEGRADIAALDAVTWGLLQRHATALPLRELARTAPTPGLPYITARHRDPAPVFAAVAQAIAALTADDRETLQLRALVAIPQAAYLAVPIPPAPDQIAQRH
ncbi:MAG: PhnD/SsuA/transferrin family substrate-binding protein [Pseudomonadota bacterium]